MSPPAPMPDGPAASDGPVPVVPAELVELLRRYDDDAWVALANRGLVRRAHKDLATTPPELVADEPAEGDAAGPGSETGAVLRVENHTVRIPVTGPAHARCDCPSAGICRHVLTASLFLAELEADLPTAGNATRDVGERATTDTESGTRESGDDEPPTRAADMTSESNEAARSGAGARSADRLGAELLGFDTDALVAYAGIATVRRAYAFVTDANQPPRVVAGDYLTVTFERPDVTVRYLGGGLGALSLDRDLADPMRYQVAAVFAWQRANGREPDPPAAAKTTSAATASKQVRTESRARLRTAVLALLTDTVAVGVAHVSASLLERYTTCAVWAQGVEYHRLARMLRGIAGEIELVVTRTAARNGRDLLADISQAYALTSALGTAYQRNPEADEPIAWVGRARAAYDPIGRLELIGLGGQPWRTDGGYHGLTCVFYAPGNGRFYTWTDARPTDLWGFSPTGRWLEPGPWSGLSSPGRSCGTMLTLTNARVGDGDRISGVDRTSAIVRQMSSGELREVLPAYDSWTTLATERGAVTSLIAASDPNRAWAVLQPSAAMPARFDPVTQELRWPLLDAEGHTLDCRLEWSDLTAPAITRLEQFGELGPNTLVVARVWVRSGWPVAEPVSLVLPMRAVKAVEALAFSTADAPSAKGRSRKSNAKVGTTVQIIPEASRPAITVPASVNALAAWLEAAAERGTAGVSEAVFRRDLERACRRVRDDGFGLFSGNVSEPAASMVLVRYYVVRQLLAGLGEAPGE